MEGLGLVVAQVIRCPFRVYARQEQGFISVKIAQSGDYGLVEQDGLDWRFAARQKFMEDQNREARFQRLNAHFLHGPCRIGQQPEVAEFARIDKPHLPPVVQREGVSDHGRRFAPGIVDAQAARHAQVHDQELIIVQRSDQVLAPPLQICGASPGNALDELAYGRLMDRIGPGYIRRREPPTDQAAAE